MPEAISEAVAATLPLALFLTAALSISADAERHGVARVAAGRLAGWGRGDARLLYGLVCLATLVLTAAISLDGAVILLVPVVNTLHQRYRVPLRPLFLGCVVVANASSLALPQGNPTNLVVIQGLGVDPVSFSRHTAVPALVATAVVVIAVAVLDRGVLNGRYNASGGTVGGAGLSPAPVLAIAATTVGNVAALALGAPPWAPICVAGLVLWAWRAMSGAGGGFVRAPVRISLQVLVLVAVTDLVFTRLGSSVSHLGPAALVPMVAVAAAAALLAAVVTNLPPSVALGQLPVHLPFAYAALAGLSVGALVAPRGSVATLIAFDLAEDGAAPIRRSFAWAVAPAAAVATAAAVTLLWAGGA
jgi:Na+/H+ antiporter NhaD/arsenite permease-like protein